MVILMIKQQMPQLQPHFWLLMSSMNGLAEPHSSQSLTHCGLESNSAHASQILLQQ